MREWFNTICLVVFFLLSSERAWAQEQTEAGDAADVDESSRRAGLLDQARDYALTGGGSGIILHRGKPILVWGDQDEKYDLKSTTKSFGATALGVAMKDGNVALNAPASKYHPYNGGRRCLRASDQRVALVAG